jgi:hypothetical protein
MILLGITLFLLITATAFLVIALTIYLAAKMDFFWTFVKPNQIKVHFGGQVDC